MRRDRDTETLAPGQAATRSTGAPGEEVIAPPLTWAA
jgi:hypothetical protein